MRPVAAVLLACALAACGPGAPELSGAPGDIVELEREFMLERDGERHLTIEQDLVVVFEDARNIEVTCEAVRVWIGRSREGPDFDSTKTTVADVLASDDSDMAAVYAATWADASLVRLCVRLDDAMNVAEVTVRDGEPEGGSEEEDAVHAVLSEALSQPASLLPLLVAIGDLAAPIDVRAFGDRVACTAAYRGINVEGDGLAGHAWAGDAHVRGPAKIRAARVTTGRTVLNDDTIFDASWRLGVSDDDGASALVILIRRRE